ncbi:hypothetical protein GH714_036730 [Hevea brasiliensis]|uniref:Uncharacterized protein n=1 Tax=Hevea brasiliensis TaxID=3981 RepID=A0A6A6NF12_HEVBR|nr:hypothetical protein GH714_036730 [Hevea brasiliensis]
MENRVEMIERNMAILKEEILQLRTERDCKLNDLWEEMSQALEKMDAIKGLLTCLVKGKSTHEELEGASASNLQGETSDPRVAKRNMGISAKRRSPNMTWEKLSAEILQRYGDDVFANPVERLAAVKQ